MLARVFFLMALGALMAIVVALMGVGLFSGGPPNTSTPSAAPSPSVLSSTASDFKGQTSQWTVAGRIIEARTSGLEVQFQVRDSAGQPPPANTKISVNFEMVEHQMRPVRALVMELRPGAYHALSALSMTGRWIIRIELPDGAILHAVRIDA